MSALVNAVDICEDEAQDELLWGEDRQRATAVLRVVVLPKNNITDGKDNHNNSISSSKLASLIKQTTWTSARDVQWHESRELIISKEEDDDDDDDIPKDALAAVDARMSIRCRSAEEGRMVAFLRQALIKSDELSPFKLEIEVLLTAPGYVPLVERRYSIQDLVLTTTTADHDHNDNNTTALFESVGVAVCEKAVDKREVDYIRAKVYQFIAEVEACFAEHHPEIEYGKDAFTFKEIASRGGERYDALVNLDDDDDNPQWEELQRVAKETAPWLEFINAVLEKEWKVTVSVVYSRPGAKDQGWHCDGPHLHNEAGFDGQGHSRPYGVCVFMPLIDLDHKVGFTQFFVKSHKTSKLLGYGQACHMLGADFDGIVGAGQSVIYDYRLMHRGMANQTTDRVRPILQFLYTKPFYEETRNYGVESMYPCSKNPL